MYTRQKWLREKSSFVLNEILLKPWFEKGSQRYSFEDLGNLQIEESALLK
ncbi:TipC family immunity protein [Streptococcus acidominimus]